MFTYRDFEMGTLGLAWTGDLKNAGGVCEKNGVRPKFILFIPYILINASSTTLLGGRSDAGRRAVNCYPAAAAAAYLPFPGRSQSMWATL